MPVVSVIIISWNNAKHLLRCLDALKSETYKDFEVIIVDNGSIDNPMDGIQQRDLSVRMKRLETNTGFAIANNIGAHLAKKRWLALLNAAASLNLIGFKTAGRDEKRASEAISNLLIASPDIIMHAAQIFK